MNEHLSAIRKLRRGRGWKLAGLGAAIAGVLALGACGHGGPGWHQGRYCMHGQVNPEPQSFSSPKQHPSGSPKPSRIRLKS